MARAASQWKSSKRDSTFFEQQQPNNEMNTPTPTPRADAAWNRTFDSEQISAGQTARALRECSQQLETELNAATAERDQLRAERNNLRADLDAIKAILNEEKARAERAEDNLAALEQCHDDNCRGVVKIADEHAVERARLDWLESPAGMDWQWQAGITRATIDAKMQKDAK